MIFSTENKYVLKEYYTAEHPNEKLPKGESKKYIHSTICKLCISNKSHKRSWGHVTIENCEIVLYNHSRDEYEKKISNRHGNYVWRLVAMGNCPVHKHITLRHRFEGKTNYGREWEKRTGKKIICIGKPEKNYYCTRCKNPREILEDCKFIKLENEPDKYVYYIEGICQFHPTPKVKIHTTEKILKNGKKKLVKKLFFVKFHLN